MREQCSPPRTNVHSDDGHRRPHRRCRFACFCRHGHQPLSPSAVPIKSFFLVEGQGREAVACKLCTASIKARLVRPARDERHKLHLRHSSFVRCHKNGVRQSTQRQRRLPQWKRANNDRACESCSRVLTKRGTTEAGTRAHTHFCRLTEVVATHHHRMIPVSLFLGVSVSLRTFILGRGGACRG